MALSKIKKLILVEDAGAMIPAAGATCYVYHATTLTLAQMYIDRNGSVLASNPATIGSTGYLDRYIESGAYDLRVVSGLDETTYPDFLAVDDIIISGPSGELQFSDIANLKAATPLNQKSYKVNWASQLGRKVSTVVHNTTSNAGGAEYVITNVNPVNLSTLVGGIWRGRNHDLGGGFYAKLYGRKLTAAMFGMVAGTIYDNTDSWSALTRHLQNGDTIDLESGEYRVFEGIAGVPSSAATPATTKAVTFNQLPLIEGKRNFELTNGTVYAASQSTAAVKSYYPCTLSLKGCRDAKVSINLEGKGENYGDADASVSLSDADRAVFLPYNSGCPLLVELSKNIKISGEFRLTGSVSAVYISSSSRIKINDSFANAASLGYAAYAIDAWVGDTTVSGFRTHDTYIKSCSTHKESLTTRDTLVAVGSSVYASKGSVVIEDPSVKCTVEGGYYADAYPNGSARDIGAAFFANASTMTVTNVVVENCAALGMTGQSVNFVGRLIVSNSEARNLRKTLHQIQATSFGVQEFEYSNVTAEINNTGIWAGDGNTAREISSVVANMKLATTVHGKITNCEITGPECIWVNDVGCYGSLLISGCRIATKGWLCKSGGWGGSSRTYGNGIVIDGCIIHDTSAQTDAYMQYANNGGGAFTYVNLDFDTSELTCETVRPAYSLTAAGSGLVTQFNGFPRMLGAWSDSSYLRPSSYVISYKEQRGLSGANRKVVFEYPNRIAFKPYVVFDAVTAGANSSHAVLSAVGAAVVNADGNVEQEWFINDTGLTLWAADERLISQMLSPHPPLL
jgi:hypothetical protein